MWYSYYKQSAVCYEQADTVKSLAALCLVFLVLILWVDVALTSFLGLALWFHLLFLIYFFRCHSCEDGLQFSRKGVYPFSAKQVLLYQVFSKGKEKCPLWIVFYIGSECWRIIWLQLYTSTEELYESSQLQCPWWWTNSSMVTSMKDT